MADRLEIRELVLRLPGVGRDDAARIAEEIASRVAHSLPGLRLETAPRLLDLRVRVPPHTRPDELPALVARQIVSALR